MKGSTTAIMASQHSSSRQTFDHVGHGEAGQVQQALDVEVIGSLSPEDLSDEGKHGLPGGNQTLGLRPTSISSKSVLWSKTLTNSVSQVLRSSSLVLDLVSPSLALASTCFLQYSMTLAKILPVTFGSGMTNSSSKSASSEACQLRARDKELLVLHAWVPGRSCMGRLCTCQTHGGRRHVGIPSRVLLMVSDSVATS